MASGKSLSLRYGPQKHIMTIVHVGQSYRDPERVERKAAQLAVRRAAKARKRAQERH